MRHIISILMIIFLTESNSIWGQNISDKYPNLKRSVLRINSERKLYKKYIYQSVIESDTTKEITGYFKNKQIKKLVINNYSPKGTETLDCYFDGGSLVFIYETLASKTKPIEINFIGRYYFKDDKLIDFETTGHNRFEDDSLDIQTILLEEMEESLKRLKVWLN